MNFKLSYYGNDGLFTSLLSEVDPALEKRIKELEPLRRILPERGVTYCIGIKDRDEDNKPILLKEPKSLKQAIKLSEKYHNSRRY